MSGEDKDGNLVIIENQLEKTDHDHLGKIITYLSVLDAKKAAWIVKEARPEHVQAISWLNESASADFYLIKVEAVRIGSSAPAPLLTRIVGPSEEIKQGGQKKRELAARHTKREEFWAQLLEKAKTRTKLHANISPSRDNWIGAGAGVSGVQFIYRILVKGATVGLFLDGAGG